MGATIFIGDELTAAGFRLTGVETMVPAPGGMRAALAKARERARLVIVTAGLAEQIPRTELEAALLTETPILVVIPDILVRMPAPDLVKVLRRVLGIEK